MESQRPDEQGAAAQPMPGMVDIAIDTTKIDPDDDDDWEYEYSETDKEVYYLTLDLSIPQWVYRNTMGIRRFGRGGYVANKINGEELEQPRSFAQKYNAPGADIEDDDDNDDDDEPLPEPEDDLGRDSDRDVPTREDAGEGEAAAAAGGPEDGPTSRSSHFQQHVLRQRPLEILDLHTAHPVISYRGKVFEASWAEVVGTELLFAHHGGGDTTANPPSSSSFSSLPRLRALPDGIDLLGAGTARLLARERTLRQPEADDPYGATKEEHGLRVLRPRKRVGPAAALASALGGDAHRADEDVARQTTFLENLWAAKVRRGEKDMPTTVAKRRPGQDHFPDDLDPDRPPALRPRGRAVTVRRQKAEEAAAAATLLARAAAYGQHEGDISDHGGGGAASILVRGGIVSTEREMARRMRTSETSVAVEVAETRARLQADVPRKLGERRPLPFSRD